MKVFDFPSKTRGQLIGAGSSRVTSLQIARPDSQRVSYRSPVISVQV